MVKVACCTSGFRLSTAAEIPPKSAATAGIVFALRAGISPFCTALARTWATFDSASRCGAVSWDCVLQVAAPAGAGNRVAATAQNKNKERLKLGEFSSMAAAFHVHLQTALQS